MGVIQNKFGYTFLCPSCENIRKDRDKTAETDVSDEHLEHNRKLTPASVEFRGYVAQSEPEEGHNGIIKWGQIVPFHGILKPPVARYGVKHTKKTGDHHAP